MMYDQLYRFIFYAVRPYELCFVEHDGKLVCVFYAGERDCWDNINVPDNLWYMRVVGHEYRTIKVLQTNETGNPKECTNVSVHYIKVRDGREKTSED